MCLLMCHTENPVRRCGEAGAGNMVAGDLTMPRRSERFGAAVCHVLDERGLSVHTQRARTGIDHDTVARMRNGIVPRMDKVIQFARAFGRSVNEWLELAGYDPIEPEWDPDRALMVGIRRIQEDTGADFQISAEELQLKQASPEEVAAILAAIRRRVEQRTRKPAGQTPEGSVGQPDKHEEDRKR